MGLWLAAVLIVVGQGVLIWTVLRFVRSFGVYTTTLKEYKEAVIYAHNSNRIVHEQTLKILQDMKDCHHQQRSA